MAKRPKWMDVLGSAAAVADAILSAQSRTGPKPMLTPFERVLVKDVEVLDIRTDPPEVIDPEDP